MLLFSFPLSRENGRGQRKVGSFLLFLHAPPKYLFWRNEDFDRASHSNSKHSLVHIPVVCEKDRPPLPSPPLPRRASNLKLFLDLRVWLWRTRCVRRDFNRCIPRMIVHIVSAFVRRHT